MQCQVANLLRIARYAAKAVATEFERHRPGLTVMTVFAMAVATIVFLYSSYVVRTSAANITIQSTTSNGTHTL